MDGNQHDSTHIGAARAADDVTAAMRDPRTRRDFLRAAGLGGVTLAIGGTLAACADTSTSPLAPGSAASLAVVNGNNITLDFSSDIDVLNYAYALEQLEAAFYSQVVATPGFDARFAANERIVLVDLRDHEVAHREFFRAALGGNAIPDLSVDFSSINFSDRTSVLTTARTFEDLGVGAYNGAGRYLRNADFLTVAGKIVSVEARHAAAIRDVLDTGGTAFSDLTSLTAFSAVAGNGLDGSLEPAQVLQAADPFIETTVSIRTAPTR